MNLPYSTRPLRSATKLRQGPDRRLAQPGGIAAYAFGMTASNVLYYGDNLDVLRRDVKEETVDLRTRPVVA